ncbi:hypothetical protein PR048_010665 [Dryococelus australis]|uniref:Reverse transcriptase n=1 Tax=Dryococelus australis TaxID=614101 RepID=A0ABQ9I3E1_9NEOP|nr:hypothetical protein PR048_010665 [Dryococelus australis]
MLRHMQDDLVVLSEYFRINKLVINADKTNYVIFTSSRSNHNINTPLQKTSKQITRAHYVKYLGLYIDEYLNWKYLPDVGILWRLRGIPVEIKNTIYNSLINSHLQYLCMAWGSASKSDLKPLQIVQNKAVKAVHDLPHRTHNHKFLLNIRTEIGRKAFNFQGFQLFNAFPESLRDVQSHAPFNKALRQLLLKRLNDEEDILFQI